MSATETGAASTKRSSVIDKLKNYRSANEGDARFTLPETGVVVSFPKFRKHGVWASALRLAKNKLGKAQILYICRICLFDGEKLTEADFREYIPMSDANELLAEIFGSDDEDEDDEGNGPTTMGGELRLSSLDCHIYLVNRGWASSDLDAMQEEEFLCVFEEQVAMDEAKAEAERKAVEKASKG